MANPRYYPPKESGRDSKLATALQFANLGLEQQQVADRQQSSRVAQALQLLGLQQQQTQDAARNQQAADMLASQNAHQSAVLGEAKLNRQGDERGRSDALAMQLVTHMLANPQVPIDTALGFAPSSQQPQVDKMHAAALQSRIGQATAAVSPIYQANAQNPHKIAELLAAIHPSFAAQPEVWNGIPWDQLNQALPGMPAEPSAPILGPLLGTHPSQAPRQGGAFGAPTRAEQQASGVITNPNMDQVSAEAIIARNLASVRGQNKSDLDHLFNLLFGQPTH